jgi:hypothetical protein
MEPSHQAVMTQVRIKWMVYGVGVLSLGATAYLLVSCGS